MFLLTLKDKKDEGSYAVDDGHGDKDLFLFEHEDDAERYAMMLELEKSNYSEMDIIEVDEELAIKTCKMHNYKYAVITPNDIVIPPKHDKIQED